LKFIQQETSKAVPVKNQQITFGTNSIVDHKVGHHNTRIALYTLTKKLKVLDFYKPNRRTKNPSKINRSTYLYITSSRDCTKALSQKVSGQMSTKLESGIFQINFQFSRDRGDQKS